MNKKVARTLKSKRKSWKRCELAFWGAAGGKFWGFRVFSIKIPYVWAYMTFSEFSKILFKKWAYMTSYMLIHHCKLDEEGVAPASAFPSD